jgi:hypothetical protein
MASTAERIFGVQNSAQKGGQPDHKLRQS